MCFIFIIIMVIIGIIALKICEFLHKEMAMFPLVFMLMLDITVVYLFKNFLHAEKEVITIGIMIATLLKISIFLIIGVKNNTN